MVRTQSKQPEDEKKETRKKKTPAKPKKTSEAGVWPCKINGCNKQFAREADLKRHQRTTKSHSMPGFACPQCDATFTRTDALRRHQKSRHNGVIIEPVDTKAKDEEDNEAGSSGSKADSPGTSTTGKGKGKGRAKKTAVNAANAAASAGTVGPAAGPSSYYRQHTMQNVFFPQGMMIDPQQYANGMGLPTSATRLHQASWPPPPPWADGGQPQMGTISYHPGSQPGFYQPSPYYRQNGQPMAPPNVMQQPFVNQPQDMQNGMSPHPPPPPSAQDIQASRTGTPVMQTNQTINQQAGDIEMANGGNMQGSSPGSAPVIDPSLDISGNAGRNQNSNAGSSQNGQGSSSKPVSLEITQAAMEAVLQSAQRESSRASGTPDLGPSNRASPNGHSNPQSINGSQHMGMGIPPQSNGGMGLINNTSIGAKPQTLQAPAPPPPTTGKSPFAHQPQPVVRPEPMEPMLTEDGEPMLNPAELLTQESLASPPPS